MVRVKRKGLMAKYSGAVFLLLLSAYSDAISCQNDNTSIKPSTPSQDFTTHGNGTVTHHTTGLMWMQCSLGQAWRNGECQGVASVLSWQQALQLAETTEFALYSDWRLPNKNELASIVEQRCWNPGINEEVFPSTPPDWFWSSTPGIDAGGYAWLVNFNNGNLFTDYKSDLLRVRLVRSGL